VPYWIVVPAASVAGILAARVVRGPNLCASGAVTIQLAATGLALAVGAVLVFRALRKVPDNGSQTVTDADHDLWRRAFWRLGVYNVVSTVMTQSDVLVVAAILGAAASGPYSVAARTATLLSFFLLAANAVIGPKSARLFHQGRLAEIEAELQRTVLVVSALSVAAWIAVLVGGRLVLGLFGADIAADAYGPLVILGVGQVVNSCTGPVVLLLNMTGLEGVAVRAITVAAVVGLALEVALGLAFGVTGVAVGSAVVICALNSYLVLEVRRRLHLHVLPGWSTVADLARRAPVGAA
jgi:O-antigen/teichoic acid export membrane protein